MSDLDLCAEYCDKGERLACVESYPYMCNLRLTGPSTAGQLRHEWNPCSEPRQSTYASDVVHVIVVPTENIQRPGAYGSFIHGFKVGSPALKPRKMCGDSEIEHQNGEIK
jgi:hypothetical protein